MSSAPGRPRRWTRAWVRAAGALGLLVSLGAAFMVWDGWSAFGQSAAGPRRERMERSPQWSGGAFENPQPLWNDFVGTLGSVFSMSPHATPSAPIPVERPEPARFSTPPPSGLRVTWLGHSSVLIEIDGLTVLTDPIWGPRASPYTWVGPARWYEPLIPLEKLPKVDVVLISHDHYDHLDEPTLKAMRNWDTLFITPLGVGAHLAYWGIEQSRIHELDWWEETRVGEVHITCTPARHASGRHLLDQNATLWAGYALVGPKHRAFFSGDTGLFPAMRDIGERLGPFDVTMIEVGAYNRAWPDWHIGPEQAVRAHGMLRGKVLLPIHWGLFNLAMHGWTEPIERVRVAAEAAQVQLVSPPPGRSIEPGAPPPLEPWWPQLTWQTAAEHPIVSTRIDSPGEQAESLGR